MKKFIAGAAVAGTATIMALSFAPQAQAADGDVDGDSITVSPPTAPETPGTTVVSAPTSGTPTVSDVSTVQTVDSSLPNTGGPSGLLLGGGAALVVAGGAAVVVSRRRQTV
jgi:LPXTG-motif cell wall-anchored protein